MPGLPLVRVRLKHPDVKTFVERFAPNVTRGGVFLASREPRPVGSLIRFEVTLVNGLVVMSGEGRVTWVKPYNASEPQRPHGMGVQFTELDPTCRPMLERLLERREATGRKVSSPPPAQPPPWRQAYTERRSAEPVSSEFDTVEDTALRRALDRARVLAGKPEGDEVEKELESLLAPGAEGPETTLEQALGELPRFLARGRGSGLFRLPPPPAAAEGGAVSAPVAPPEAAVAPGAVAVPESSAAPEVVPARPNGGDEPNEAKP